MQPRKLQALGTKFDKAVGKGKLAEAEKVLLELRRVDGENARWSLRGGDLYRRMGKMPEAVAFYERAVELYLQQGFLPRAIAMAKTIVSLDPSRADILDALTQEGAQALRPPPPAEPTSPPPAPVEARSPSLRPAADVVNAFAAPLEVATDAAEDEIRFADAGDYEMYEVEVAEVEVGGTAVTSLDDVFEGYAEQMASMPSFPLFANVPQDAFRRLVNEAELVEALDGMPLVRAGQNADALFAIVSGEVTVDIPEVPGIRDATLGEGDVFGEACLLEGGERSADVTAMGEVRALRIPKTVLDDVATEHIEVASVLFDLLTRRLVSNLLRTSPFFAPFDPPTRQEIARLFEVRHAIASTVLLRAGKRSDGLYLPLSGYLEVESDAGASRAGRGTVLGMHSLFSQEPSRISARTGTETVLLRLPKARFQTIITQYPPVLAHIAELTERSQDEPVQIIGAC